MEETDLQNHFAYGWSCSGIFQIAQFFRAAGIEDTNQSEENEDNYSKTIRTTSKKMKRKFKKMEKWKNK